MLLNTLEVTLTPRTEADAYNLQLNEAALDILGLVFEFKVVTAWQIARFLGQKEESKYLYLKLRRIWQAGLLESFKLYTGSRAGMPVYYMLSKKGLRLLAEKWKYASDLIKSYPRPRTLFSWSIFRHELQVVELASQEVKNGSKDFAITFKGELTSQAHEARSDKNIEIFTPDYTVFYRMQDLEKRIYTEFERTNKSLWHGPLPSNNNLVKYMIRFCRLKRKPLRRHFQCRVDAGMVVIIDGLVDDIDELA